ncbi:MAG: hypothetical protein LUK37_05865 [Clostridia bacterium]|nr:hypothetical protein [Clostridia bacterium]
MDAPIYSDNKTIGKENELRRHIIAMLSEDAIQEINSKITFVSHGIYLFPSIRKGDILSMVMQRRFSGI